MIRLNNQAIEAIEAILKHGNNAIVRRDKSGVVVSEQTVKIKYRTSQRSDWKDNGSQP